MGLLNFVGKLLGLSGTPNQKIELTKSATAAGLPIIYGHRRVDAITVLKRVSNRKALAIGNGSAVVVENGPDNRADPLDHNNWLHRIDVWGQGPIEEVTRFWIDGDTNTHKRFQSKRPYFRAASMLGSLDQSALTGLGTAAPQWGANHRGLGVAYSWTRFFNSSKHPQYRSEPALKAEIKGLRLYDPRQDVAHGGTGSHSFADDSTWSYSNNRALVVLNYLMSVHGLGAAEGEIDLNSFIVAANICDQEINIPPVVTNQTGSVVPNWYDWRTGGRIDIDIDAIYPTYRPSQVGSSQKRYEADAVIDPKDDVVRNLERLLEEFDWSLTWSNGKHRLVIADVVTSPVMTINEDDIVGGWTMERGSRASRLNRVTVEFPNANKNFEDDTVSWPERSSATYTAFRNQDGGRDLHTNVSLSTVTDFYRAKAYAEFHVHRSRVGERITGLQLAPRALVLEPGDVIAIDFADKGLSAANDWFIVDRVSVSGTVDVSVDLRRYDPVVYGAEASDNEPLGPNDDNADAFEDPNAINNLQAYEYHAEKADGSVISGIRLTWEAPTSGVPVEHIEVKWRDIADTNFTGDNYQGTLRFDSDTTACRIPDLADNRQYRVVVSYVTRLRQRSIEAVLDPVDLTPTTNSKLDTIEEGATRTEHQGAYSNVMEYRKGDVVSFEGSSFLFISSIPATGIDPANTTYWALLASAGAVWHDGNGTPGAGLGGVGDYYLDKDAGDVYRKTGASSWALEGNIAGNDGDAWHSGITVPDGSLGTSGDRYLRTTTGDVYVKAGSSWVFDTNIRGADGPQGPQGIQGPPGPDGQPRYLWIAYASNATGTQNFTTGNPTSVHTYFGTAANQTTVTEGTNPAVYTWKRLPNGMTEAEIVAELGWNSSTLDTENIQPEAVSDTNWSMSSYSSTNLPENVYVEKGSVSVNGYNNSTDQVLVIGNANFVVYTGKVNIEVYIRDQNTTRNVGFVTEQRHTVGTAEKYFSVTASTRFTGNISPPFEMRFRATFIGSGASVFVRNVGMTALVTKR